MYEQGTDSSTPSEKLKGIESATVELCSKRPSGLTEIEEVNTLNSQIHLKTNILYLPKEEYTHKAVIKTAKGVEE